MPGEIHPVRAETSRGAQGHGRMHPIAPGDVVGGRHHPTLAAAHDHRLAPQRRIAVLFHGGEERVEVEMRYHPVGSPGTNDDLSPFHVQRIAEHLFGDKGDGEGTASVAMLASRLTAVLARSNRRYPHPSLLNRGITLDGRRNERRHCCLL